MFHISKGPDLHDDATITPSGPEPRTRMRWLIWAKLIVSVGLLILLISRIYVHSLWWYARAASPMWLAMAIALYFVMVAISVWRWAALLRAQHVTVSYATLTKSFLTAAFYNNFLPSNIGGDVVRIADTASLAGSRTLAATVV